MRRDAGCGRRIYLGHAGAGNRCGLCQHGAVFPIFKGIPSILRIRDLECATVSIGTAVGASRSGEVRHLRAILRREGNSFLRRIPEVVLGTLGERAHHDVCGPFKSPHVLGVEVVDGRIVNHVRVTLAEIGPCQVVVAVGIGPSVIKIGVDDKIDLQQEESCEGGILDGDGDRDDGLWGIGVVLREEHVDFQIARRSMDSNGSAGQKQGAAGDEARQGAREETMHG